jgi:hypothetical protein
VKRPQIPASEASYPVCSCFGDLYRTLKANPLARTLNAVHEKAENENTFVPESLARVVVPYDVPEVLHYIVSQTHFMFPKFLTTTSSVN